jgi:deoxycytidine triphosphate deaminase/intein/homing endonuclease
MILSDRTIREQLAAGRIVIDPFDESCIQPSSVDLRLDRLFRVFLNHTMPVIDVKQNLEELTRLVEIDDGDAFILHPGEFVLGSTAEAISLPDDLVARIEGKSSLGRLGLLIHSSLPGSEPVLVLDGDRLVSRAIEEVVRKQQRVMVAAFDPETFEVGFHEITGWYEGPPDRIFEVELGSGRRVRVTAGHNLFTLDRAGQLTKVRTGALRPGVRVAVPRALPDPVPSASSAPEIVVTDLVPDPPPDDLSVAGPSVAAAFGLRDHDLPDLLADGGFPSIGYHRPRSTLPYTVARLVPRLLDDLGAADVVASRGDRNPVPARIEIDADRAWLFGLYVVTGCRDTQQVRISHPDRAILDRAAATLTAMGLTVRRGAEGLTVGSASLAALFGWMEMGDTAPTKRVPPLVFGWPRPLVEAFLDGVGEAAGSAEHDRTTVQTTSRGLVDDLLLLFSRIGRPAEVCERTSGGSVLRWQLDAPDVDRGALASRDRLVEGDLMWDEVVAVHDTGTTEAIFDLEVRPGGRKIENFLAGGGGVFVSNTAGFIDAGFSGHITLELSNVANLPITLYPGMKIGQVSFLRMTTPADVPYGSSKVGSKYQGQRGPTPSRYWENFSDAATDGD